MALVRLSRGESHTPFFSVLVKIYLAQSQLAKSHCKKKFATSARPYLILYTAALYTVYGFLAFLLHVCTKFILFIISKARSSFIADKFAAQADNAHLRFV